MRDPGSIAAERGAVAIERRLRKLYRNAQKELRKTIADFNMRFMAQDAKKRAAKEAGEITEEEYQDWVRRTVFRGKQWDAKVNHCVDMLADSNKQALNIIYGHQLSVFAENMTYQAYLLEKGAKASFGFGIYSENTVRNLLKKQPELLPRKVLNGKKDKAWNREKIASIVNQGIVQGDGIPQIAKRIGERLPVQNDEAMTRYARTAMTSAQNAGRIEMLHEAEDEGIKTKKKWLCTLDDRTREAHAELDGQTVDIDEPFVVEVDGERYEIDYPGDPKADPCMVYNCRCTLVYEVEGYENTGERRAYREWDDEDGNHHRDSYTIDGNTTYKEWKAMKERGRS